MKKCLLVFLAGMGVAQEGATPRFEVASVKPAATDERGSEMNTAPNGRLTITNLPLKSMILWAWGVKPFQLTGATGWIDSQAYDVVAQPASKPKPGEVPLMLRALLHDRFGLVVHSVTKELPVYALVLVNPGTLGPGLVEFKEGNCQEFDPAKPPLPPAPGTMPALPCGRTRLGRTGVRGAAVRIADLIDRLSPLLGRTVIDETGLLGKYDIDLRWPPPADPPQPDEGSPIFRGIQEQLGLKLQPKKGPVEILVIDRAVKPTPN